MQVIVGLGNPGAEYKDTRHNIGFMVIDRLSRELGSSAVRFNTENKLQAEIAKVGDILLVKPTTFVNKSGDAVSAILSYFKVAPSDLLVVHDDIDLPIGKIRIREKGGSAGHNGVQSIIDSVKNDKFVRFRLGTGHGKEDLGRHEDKNLRHRWVVRFVLSRFQSEEAGAIKHLIDHGTEAVRIALTEGIDKAMNRFN